MKRRLNIAAALLHDPELILLDEPTVGVDPQSRNAIFENLEELKRRGKTLVYATHYMEEAERLCDRIVIIDHGKVVADDTVHGLYRRLPASRRWRWTSNFGPLRTCWPVSPLIAVFFGYEKMTTAQNVPYNGYAQSFAGMTTQFILLAGIDAGLMLLMARERAIWQRLRSAPLSKAEFLLARTIATTLIGLFQFTLIYTAAFAIGVRVGGSVIGFAALAVALCLLNATFGLMLASIGSNAAATRGIAVLVTLVLLMAGGAWVPSFVFPKWLQQASLVLPTRWAIDGLDAMTWRGLGLHAAAAPVAVLATTAMLCLAIAIWRFSWEE